VEGSDIILEGKINITNIGIISNEFISLQCQKFNPDGVKRWKFLENDLKYPTIKKIIIKKDT